MSVLFFTVFAVDKGAHDYVDVSASEGQMWSGGGGRFEKLCVPLEKSWLCPWESSSVLSPPTTLPS